MIKKTAKKAIKKLELKSLTSKLNFSVKNENMDAETIKFKISELRHSVTNAVVESVAVSILALLLFIGAPSVFPEIINPYLPSSLKIMQSFVAVPTVFGLLVVLVNLVRYIKIFRLQRLLSSKK